GITLIDRLQQSTNASIAAIVRAYTVARDVFGLHHWWSVVEGLDHAVDARVQLQVFADLQRLLRLATRWFLHNRRCNLDLGAEVAALAAPVAHIQVSMGEYAGGEQLLAWRKRHDELLAAGLPQPVAAGLAGSSMLVAALGIVDVALTQGLPVESTARIAFALNDRLDFYWFGKQISALAVDGYWQALARESYLDELDWQLRAIVAQVVQEAAAGQDIGQCLERWESSRAPAVAQWRLLLKQIRDARTQGYAMYAVAVRALLALAQPLAP
ncbi:MAG TPA: NAD-glutamate dehydrogenase, partial [Pseudomonadales bacterium]|nr:NAD-glutamate dehydrogenase [Pseudomonadales bacterium]